MQNARTVIATNGKEHMTLEEFLLWELNGGKGTYESDLSPNGLPWNDLPINDKIAYMANSIAGDILSDHWQLTVIPETNKQPESYWSEIRNTHTDTTCYKNGDGKTIVSIDAWKYPDDNLSGEVIARVIKTKHNDVVIDYINSIAINDAYAQQIIQETVDQLKHTP